MVMAAPKTGAPYFVADFEFAPDALLKLRSDFNQACSSFRYRDIMALSRKLGVHPSTVAKWKYNMQYPNYDVIMQVLAWVNRGKPMKRVLPWQKAKPML
jgi:uncharacterized protein YjcR